MTNWTEHIKAEAKKLGISYGCAMSLPEVQESYRSKNPDAGKKKKRTPKKEDKVKNMVQSIETKIKDQGIKGVKGKVSVQEIAEEIAEIETAGIKSKLLEKVPKKDLEKLAELEKNFGTFSDQANKQREKNIKKAGIKIKGVAPPSPEMFKKEVSIIPEPEAPLKKAVAGVSRIKKALPPLNPLN